MIKNIFRRILSIASALAIVFTAYPPVIFADDGGLCPHHPEHTAECGYVEGVSPCNFVCEICDAPEASDSTEPSDTPEPEVTTSPEDQPPVTTAPEPEPVETGTTETMPEESETMPTEPLPEPDSSPAGTEIQLMAVNEEHVAHDEITDWKAWEIDNSLPTSAGNWYLTKPVTLADNWSVSAGEIKLCLNGQTVNCGVYQVKVENGASLTVYDCKNGSGITGSGANTVDVDDGGGFTLKSGNIVNDSATGVAINAHGYSNPTHVTINSGTVESLSKGIVATYSTVTVTDGVIKGGNSSEQAYGIYSFWGTLNISGGTITGGSITGYSSCAVASTDCTFNLSGEPIIESENVDINLEGTIHINDPLSGGPYSVQHDTGTFATGDYAAASKGCFVPAEEGYSIVADSDGLKLVAGHAHDGGETFETPWSDPNSLPTTAGNYYLTEDVTLENYLFDQGSIKLCLNGHSVTTSTDGVAVKDFTVYDCQGGGEIGGKAMDTISVNGPSYNFTLESGKISNSHFSGCAISASSGEVIINGGEVYGSNNGISISRGTVTITDGIITAEQNYAINAGTGTLKLSGKPDLNGREADIYIHNGYPMNISGLTNTEPYSVAMDTPGVFATVTDGRGAEDYVKNFTSANDDYTVVAEGNTLKLVERHIHDDGKEFTAWTKNNELPSEAGSYFLTTDVTLSANWDVSSDITLCLNGQTVNCGGNQITVGSGSSLTVYDDLDKKGEISGSSDKTIYVNGGEFTLKSGKIFNDNSNWEAVRVDNSGTATIEGGTVEANSNDTIHGASASVIKVTGGEIKGGSGSLVYAIESSGMLEISGGNITSAGDKAVRISSDCNFNLFDSPVIAGIIRLDGGSAVITIDKPLSGQYVVSCEENQIFAQGSCAAEAKDCFELPQDLQDEGYVIVAVENGLKATIPHEHDGINFEVWDDSTSLPSKAGNYVLDSTVMLRDTWKVPEGETTLCLNGNMIMSMSGSIEIPENATLTIYDCSKRSNGDIHFDNAACINVSGKLKLRGGTVENSLSGKAINVGSSGLLIIEDGTVSGYDCAIHGESGSDIIIHNGEIRGDQGPAISTAGNLTVSGGYFSGTLTHGIEVTGELTLTGNPNISINGMYQYSAAIHVTKPINIPAPIFGESYSVYMDDAPGVFAKGEGAAESVKSFTSADEKSEIQKVGAELWLVPKGAHVHEDGIIFDKQLTSYPGTLESGNYYLNRNLYPEYSDIVIPEGAVVNLCLNNLNLLQTDGCVRVQGTLNIYDCGSSSGNEIDSNGVAIVIEQGGNVTLYDGHLESQYDFHEPGGGTAVTNAGVLTIVGGDIQGDITSIENTGTLNLKGGTVNGKIDTTAGTCNISGSPTVTDVIKVSSDHPLGIAEALTNDTPLKISMDDPGVFASSEGAVASIDCFKLTDELESKGYEIAIDGETLVARLKTYTITYDPGEGSGSIDSQTKTHGTDITISGKIFTRPGYTQIGWSTKQGASDVEYDFDENYTDNANLTLYPVWEQNEIHFYKGGEEIDDLSLKVGESAEISVKITPESAVCSAIQWTVDNGISIDPDTGYTVTVTGDSAGEFKLTASTDDGQTTKTLIVTVRRSDSAVSAVDQTVTYGENVTIKAKVEKAAANGISLMSLYDNKVTFRLGYNELGTADVVGDTATLTIPATRANGFAIGNNTVTLEYSGNDELEPITGSVTVTVNKKTLTATVTGTTTKTYDGTTSADGLELELSDIVVGDTVSASAEFAYDSANAGKRNITAKNATLTGTHAGYYELSTPVSIPGTIAPLPAEFVWTGDEFAYDGTSHEVTATVGNAVGDDKFKLTYSENTAKNVGNYTAKVTVLGNENYTLSGATGIEHEWKITALSLADADIQIVGTYTYNGEVQTPEIRVTLGGKEILSGKDYTLEYSGEVKDANTYTVTITGTGNYSGSASTEFEIAPKSLTARISGTLSKVYDSTTDVNDDVKIALTGVIGTDDVTATPEFSYDSANAGARKIAAKNITLSGEDAKNYTLSSKQAEALGSITPAPIDLPNTEFIYGGEAKTVIQVSGIGETITATLTAFSSDTGEYEYSEVAKESCYTVELSSENYKVQSAGTLTIKPLVAVIEWQGGEFTYDGTVHEVTATVKNAVAGDKFEIAYTGNAATNAGDYTAKVTALGNANYTLSGSAECEWKIAPRVAEIEWIGGEFTYDGKSHTVTATVKNAVDGDKFNITYTNNTATESGNYTAKVTTLGNANYTLSGATEVEHAWKITAASQAAPEVKIDFINETLSTDEAMEFSADGETWQDCTAAMNVAKTGWSGSALTVKIRYKKDVDHIEGEIQSLVIPARRAAPDISETTVSKSQTEITIAEIPGCEYSLDGATWQDTGVFSGLDKGATYEIFVRYKATASAFASFGSSRIVVTSTTADGTTELLPGETVAAGDGSIKNLGGEIIIDDGEGNETVITLPNDGSVEVDEQGNVIVPDGGEVAVRDNPAVILPEGGKVEPDGTVIADEVKIGDTDVKGEDVTVTPDGNITVPGEGSVKVGDNPEITLSTGGTVEPDGTVIADEVKVGNTDVTGEDVTVTPAGNITVPGEGQVTVGDNPEIILPTGGTVEPDGTVIADEVKVGNTDVKGEDVTVAPDEIITLPEGGKVSADGEPEKIVPAGMIIENGVINAPAIAEAEDGSKSLGDDIILKIEPADERLETADRENLKDAANAIVREVYDIELLKNGVEVEPDKSIKLTVSADVSGAKMKVFTLDNDGKFNEIDAEFDAENGKFTIVTDSLGIFILTSEEGQISAEVVASGGAPEVEIGDDDRKILEENLFTDEDEAAIENGDNVKVVMNVEGVSEEDVPADDIAEIEAFLGDLEGCEVAEYADITLTKITEDGVTGDEIRSEAISEINNPIKLVIDIPEALHKVGRIFSVIRLHDGKAELLNDTDRSDETVTVLTDKFSLYVLIYRDPASQPSHVHSFTAWINVGAGGHLARCAICGKVMSLMPHTMLSGVCTACGYVETRSPAYLPDGAVDIEIPTEGRIASEEVVEF